MLPFRRRNGERIVQRLWIRLHGVTVCYCMGSRFTTSSLLTRYARIFASQFWGAVFFTNDEYLASCFAMSARFFPLLEESNSITFRYPVSSAQRKIAFSAQVPFQYLSYSHSSGLCIISSAFFFSSGVAPRSLAAFRLPVRPDRVGRRYVCFLQMRQIAGSRSILLQCTRHRQMSAIVIWVSCLFAWMS